METDPARALTLVSLSPVWSAMLSRIFLKEVLPWRTVALVASGILAIALVIVPTLVEGAGSNASLRGDLIASATGLAFAFYFTYLRYVRRHNPNLPIFAGSVISAFANCFIAGVLCLTSGSDLTSSLNPEWFAVVFTTSAMVLVLQVAFTVCPRYITSAEIGLVMLLELMLGPVWVYARFGDVPSLWTVAGGTTLIFAIAVHEVIALRIQQERQLEQKADASTEEAQETTATTTTAKNKSNFVVCCGGWFV
ncbi:unnamed protein product [Polarella glacialis]|uniref:EamA domain-containing protein n=1 Tax=Polarella glacialis TaxID=89957 RepID=A0A813DLY8_POLGL|nr:unnamed protein product [Polarella glacialis]